MLIHRHINHKTIQLYSGLSTALTKKAHNPRLNLIRFTNLQNRASVESF